ncbi:Uncharacterised protein [Bordetella pertussis]|nr:Uncharacterised protein [Bordetella pertussis]CPJ96434.1 Uncharacterised protein [Bordetella pertussis]CPM02408.1 Uncharacterised protein [Bordetella pertussis]CPO93808.1 Uncharacterised protein [Bordetella pertussis]CPQ41917.1 Uncharacterised protein [Bordetella pertussis]
MALVLATAASAICIGALTADAACRKCWSMAAAPLRSALSMSTPSASATGSAPTDQSSWRGCSQDGKRKTRAAATPSARAADSLPVTATRCAETSSIPARRSQSMAARALSSVSDGSKPRLAATTRVRRGSSPASASCSAAASPPLTRRNWRRCAGPPKACSASRKAHCPAPPPRYSTAG